MTLQFLSLRDALNTSSMRFCLIFSVIVFLNGSVSTFYHWRKDLDAIVACDTIFDIAYATLNSVKLIQPGVSVNGLDIVQLLWPIWSVAHRLEDYSLYRMRDRHTAEQRGSFRRRRMSAIGLPLLADHQHSYAYDLAYKSACICQTAIGSIFCILSAYIVAQIFVLNERCGEATRSNCVWAQTHPKIFFNDSIFSTTCTQMVRELDLGTCTGEASLGEGTYLNYYYPNIQNIKFSRIIPALPKSFHTVDRIDAKQAVLPKILDFSELGLERIPRSICNMIKSNEGPPSLAMVNFSYNNLTNVDLKILGDALRTSSAASSIEVIDISGNNIVSPLPVSIIDISTMPKLHKLIASNNAITRLGIDEGKYLSAKRNIEIDGNPVQDIFITDSEMDIFPENILSERAKVLEQVSFYRLPRMLGALNPLTVASWTRLVRFEIARCPLMKGTLPTELGLLTQLTGLLLNRNAFTGTIPSQLGMLTNMDQFVVDYQDGGAMAGTLPSQLGRLAKMTRLHMWGNPYTGEIPTEYGQFRKLLYFMMYNTNINGTIPSQIGRMTQLTLLELRDNRLTGGIPTQLGQLTNLRALYLQGNRFSNTTLPWQISALPHLERIQL